ncbi:hypothetical protein Tco_0688681 [Tanacetum coccineum]
MLMDVSKKYLVFSHMLKSFDREDLEPCGNREKSKHESTSQCDAAVYKPPSVVSRAPSAAAIAPVPVDTTCIPSSTLVDQDAPSVSTSQTLEDSQEPVLHQDVEVQVPLNA